MIYYYLKRGSYCIAWLISILLIAPVIGYALVFVLAAVLIARTRDTNVILSNPGVAGRLLRWVNGWKTADRYLTWVAKFTGICH